jgi:hypothetical protein
VITTFEWLSSKVATSAVVLVISGSFLGLFGMQADYYRTLEMEDLADAITDLVTQLDLATCEASVEVNWTGTATSHGLPRTFHGMPYVIEFTAERPYLVCDGNRVAGQYFTSSVRPLDGEDEPVDLLEVSSTTGFVVSSLPVWTDRGLDHPILVQPLPPSSGQ